MAGDQRTDWAFVRAACQPFVRASSDATLGLSGGKANRAMAAPRQSAQRGPLFGQGMRANHPRPGVQQRQDVPGLGRGFQFIEQNDVIDLVIPRSAGRRD